MSEVAASSARRAAMRRAMVRRAVWPLLSTLVLVAVLFVAVFPTRTWLAQRGDRDTAARQLSVLRAQNAVLEQRVAALRTDAEIERLARKEYHLVRPGEEAYAVLPPPAPAPRASSAPAAD